jgi:hypothetical protein
MGPAPPLGAKIATNGIRFSCAAQLKSPYALQRDDDSKVDEEQASRPGVSLALWRLA